MPDGTIHEMRSFAAGGGGDYPGRRIGGAIARPLKGGSRRPRGATGIRGKRTARSDPTEETAAFGMLG